VKQGSRTAEKKATSKGGFLKMRPWAFPDWATDRRESRFFRWHPPHGGRWFKYGM